MFRSTVSLRTNKSAIGRATASAGRRRQVTLELFRIGIPRLRSEWLQWSGVLQPALSLVLHALEEIRSSQEKTFRVSRATLTRLLESPPDYSIPDVATKAAAHRRVRDRGCVCTRRPHM